MEEYTKILREHMVSLAPVPQFYAVPLGTLFGYSSLMIVSSAAAAAGGGVPVGILTTGIASVRYGYHSVIGWWNGTTPLEFSFVEMVQQGSNFGSNLLYALFPDSLKIHLLVACIWIGMVFMLYGIEIVNQSRHQYFLQMAPHFKKLAA